MNSTVAAPSTRPRTRMHPILDAVLHESPYQQLPESIRMVVSEREYLFMTDSQKANLIQTETDPETEL